MERQFMFVDRKTQCFQGVSSSQLDIQIEVIPIKIPTSYFVVIDKMMLKFIWNRQHITEGELVDRLKLPDFKTYRKATVSNTMWYW